jgi:hypothetical protein
VNLASDKDDNSRNGSQDTLACSEAQSSAKAVTAKSLAMECTNCHELQKRCRLLPRRHPILGIKLHVLLQTVEVRRSLCRRVIQPTWRPKYIRCTIVMLSSRCKSLQRRDLSTQTSIACGAAPSAVQCSRNRSRDITRYSHVALRRPKQARHVHLSNPPVPVCIWRYQPRSLSAKCRVPHVGGDHTRDAKSLSINHIIT